MDGGDGRGVFCVCVLRATNEGRKEGVFTSGSEPNGKKPARVPFFSSPPFSIPCLFFLSMSAVCLLICLSVQVGNHMLCFAARKGGAFCYMREIKEKTRAKGLMVC